MLRRIQIHWFEICTGILCLLYVVIEFVYISRLPLVMDEYQGAGAVHKLTRGIPYRDFLPYKTVLGYYIQLPAMLLPGHVWEKILRIKYEMALINGGAMFGITLMMRRHFSKRSLMVALVLLVCMSTFLERSCALRVDMLTSWAGLFSLLFILRRRFITAGLFCAASFMISQKGAYYALAGGTALAVFWITTDRTKKSFASAALFTGATLLPIGVYFLSFGLLGKGISGVGGQVIMANKAIALSDMYVEVRMYWDQTVQRNPLFYLLALMGVGRLVAMRLTKDRKDYTTTVLAAYGIVLGALGWWHKQPWPYFFVILIPTGFVLITALLEEPFLWTRWAKTPLFIILIIGGVYLPLCRVPVVLHRDSGAQRNTLRLLDQILAPDDVYLAGVNMVFNRSQPKGFGWLDRNKLNEIWTGDRMKHLATLKKTKIKAYVSSYRTGSLPSVFKDYLVNHFRRLHGNVYTYCPLVTAKSTSATLDFSGNYWIRPNRGKHFKKGKGYIRVDGEVCTAKETMFFKAGKHRIKSNRDFRFCLEPVGWETVADPFYERRELLFDLPYRY